MRTAFVVAALILGGLLVTVLIYRENEREDRLQQDNLRRAQAAYRRAESAERQRSIETASEAAAANARSSR